MSEASKNIRVLVVEDDEQTRFLYKAKLREYSLEMARNGEDGLRRQKSFDPHIILTDLTMPRMDGCQFIQQLRKTGILVPVVVITGINIDNPVQAARVDEAIKAGANRTLTKPFSRADIQTLISELLG